MNYSEMVVRWEGILDRSVLAFHHLCFICGVLAFLWAASLPFAVSASPGLSEIVGGVLAGGVSDATAIKKLGVERVYISEVGCADGLAVHAYLYGKEDTFQRFHRCSQCSTR